MTKKIPRSKCNCCHQLNCKCIHCDFAHAKEYATPKQATEMFVCLLDVVRPKHRKQWIRDINLLTEQASLQLIKEVVKRSTIVEIGESK